LKNHYLENNIENIFARWKLEAKSYAKILRTTGGFVQRTILLEFLMMLKRKLI